MATLQNIRNHGALVITIVGLAMLAFILGDFLNSGSTFFNRSRENVAVIAGHDVHYTEYEAAREQLDEVYKIETGQTPDEDQASQLRNQLWQMMLMDYSLREQAAKIGMAVTADELSELCIGEHPHQIIQGRRAFFDESGQFNREALVRFLASIDQPAEGEQAENIAQAKKYWLYWENAVRLTQMQEKYTNLVRSLVRSNSLDAQFAFDSKQQSVDVDYVMQPYSAIADSLVKVSNADIKRLYKLHRPLYKQTPNRAIEYVSFAIVPSQEDYDTERALMEDLREEFVSIAEVADVVNPNSDIMYHGEDYSENTIPAQFKDFAFRKGAKVGDVTDILFENGTYSMARIMACGYNMPDSVELKAISNQEGVEDQELGWYQANELNAAIAGPAFSGKRGQHFTVDMNGQSQEFEILEISKATPKAKVAILQRNVTPSSRTYSTLYNQAKQFIVNHNNTEALREGAKEAGLTVTPQFNLLANTDKVGSLKSSRPIVRWAYQAKEGEVSDVFECGNVFVVATLVEANDGEYRSLESVRPELTAEATKNAKAKLLAEQMKAYASLEEAAQALGRTVQHAQNISLSSYRLGNGGNEPSIVGAAQALAANTLSAPLQGLSGVYLIQVGEKKIAEGEFNAEQEKQQLNARLAYQVPYQAIALIEDKAEVEDNRANFQ